MSKTATSRLGLVPAGDAIVAPEWRVESWLNHSGELALGDLRGRVVVLHAFQILCPGCVTHGIPQAQRIRAAFPAGDVAVIGMHSVFEHHAAMRPVSLQAFVHEYRVDFPVGIDASSGALPIPQTMQAYGMRGTPTLILVDHVGRVRLHAFGRPEDMIVGAAIATLVAERGGGDSSPEVEQRLGDDAGAGCDADGCRL
jgi:hypothetical protein